MSFPLESTRFDRPWLASYPPGVPADYRIPAVAVPRLLDDAARDFPDRPALTADGSTIDHGTLRHRVDEVAGALAGAGVSAGDRVLVALPNGLAAPVVVLALWRLGAVAVPLPPDLPRGAAAAVAEHATVVAVIASRQLLAELSAAEALPDIAVLVDGTEWAGGRDRGRLARVREAPAALAQRLRRRPLRLAEPAVALSALLDQPASTPYRASPLDPDTPALLRYRPAGDEPGHAVILSHANLVAGAFQARLWIPDVQAGRERVLVADALCSPAALTVSWLAALLSATAVVLLDDPDPATVARTIEEQAPTALATTTARLAALASSREAGRRDLTSLRVCLAVTSGFDDQQLVAPATAATLERRSGGGRVRTACVLAEAGLTHAQPVYGRIVPGTVGVPVTGTHAAVVAPGDQQIVQAPGEPGLLAVAGPQVATARWLPPGPVVATPTEWLVTDVAAVMSSDGVFSLVDDSRSPGRIGLAEPT